MSLNETFNDAAPVLVDAAAVSLATPAGAPLVGPLSFCLRKGEILVLSGANGIGKTTLLRAVIGAAPLAAGQLRVEARRIAFVPQLSDRSLHLPMTLGDVVATVHGGFDGLSRALAWGLMDEALWPRAWSAASGGERQRTLITRAILADPELLILDEPLNHLDDGGRAALRRALELFVASRARGVLMVSHAAWAAGGASRRLELAAAGA